METSNRGRPPFKTCALCRQTWSDLAAMVSDPTLQVIGYQPVFDEPESGLILLQHERHECRSSVALPAGALRPWFDEEQPAALMAGQEGCPRHCLDPGSLESCHNPCRMAWVRQALQHLRRHELPPDRVKAA